MALDGILKGINKALFKEVPGLPAFVAEIKKGFDYARISVDIKYSGENIAKDVKTFALDTPDGAQGRFHVVGEAFGPSGEKVASFREIMPGSVNYGNHNEVWNGRTDIFAKKANRRLKEVVALIKAEVTMSDPDKQIIENPFVFGYRSSAPSKK